jgi:hypothetical protein
MIRYLLVEPKALSAVLFMRGDLVRRSWSSLVEKIRAETIARDHGERPLNDSQTQVWGNTWHTKVSELVSRTVV